MRMISAVACAALFSACTPTTTRTEPPTSTSADATTTARPAQVVDYVDFISDHVQRRNISVWLPADYAPDSGQTYPVIYAHDGQNLFDPSTSYAGVEWGLDEAADRLIAAGKAPPAIIVGIWNTDARWQEYAPQKAVERLTGDTASEWLGPTLPELKGDAYLRFITEELKPFIDETYRTRPGAGHTTIMGSSMGGLISLYAVAEYPDTFSRAAAVSIHWPLAEPDGAIAAQASSVMQAYLETSGIDPAKHEIWFDRGTETLDASYAPHADRMEAWFRTNGWPEDRALFRTYPGTDHSEAAWAARADEILTFLLTE